MNSKAQANRCKGRTKAGKPCRAAATEGGLCFFHANPDKAAELGRIGGRKNRRVPTELEVFVPRLVTALAMRQTVAQLIEGVIAGTIGPRIASALAPLLSLQLRAIEATDLEQRLAALEARPGKTDSDAALSGKQPTDLELNAGTPDENANDSEEGQ
jgi:hypothetical protein